ncbi:phage portal protein [Lysinibacillus irui]|uniref:Phage portal protein n=1 Tax=Lysinibacillus irui TaxID=2998077 RepID=A0ABU5NQL8_9BACI|nr:phage portal protein [Lysinibacillus irui]MEA0556070.1 phage portal protein [Lysinibacillus irui]MEA0978324.1 phage portal protein [Lysinibacillus irui]MEA1044478.1 phage portal protein [Lysinibacillus irui]
MFKKMASLSGNKEMQQARMLNGYSPIFTQFGEDIFASDVVQMCVDVIATECSKLQPKHIRIDNNGMQHIVKSSINRLFKFAPNEIMTTRDFLEKVIWLLYMNYNAFIYPMYDLKDDGRGNQTREYIGFYPLNPTGVTFLQDQSNRLFIEMAFGNGDKYTLAYSDVIHLRKKFSSNDIMGGGTFGKPDNRALLKVLSINDSLMQGLEKGMKASMSIRGIIKINTMLETEEQKKERIRFEQNIADAKSGIVPIDMKSDYIPIEANPKLVDKETLDFLDQKVLRHYGVSLPILTGDFDDEQYQAFYEKTLEPLLISLGQAFSKTIFTTRELDVGNEIIFYQREMMYLSTNAKMNLLKTAGEQGLLTDNQKLALLGYPPIPGGEKRTMSLNYIDVNLANAYQMSKKNIGTDGGDPIE